MTPSESVVVETPAAWRDWPEDGVVVNATAVHVIRVPLPTAPATSPEEWWELSATERARADRFVVEPPRRRFRYCRRAVRRALAEITGSRPESLVFGAELNGKPTLLEPQNSALVFNVSHTGDWAVLALSQSRQLGVDIETIDPHLDTAGLANRFFAEAELRELAALPPGDQRAAFYRLWTSKEAYMKALGLGMLLPLGSFWMRANPYWPPELLGGRVEQGPGSLRGFEVDATVPGVVMWNGGAADVHFWNAAPEWLEPRPPLA